LSFLERIIQQDKELLIYLNALGSETWDDFWLVITNQLSWTPLFLFLLFLLFKAYGWKKGLLLVVLIALLVAFSDQFVNLIKNYFERLRPSHDSSLNKIIRTLKHAGGFSFVSGHSTTSFATTTFLILILRKQYTYIYFLLLWPLFFAYSRIYIGVHFPIDIFIGMLLGITLGFIFYKISTSFLRKI